MYIIVSYLTVFILSYSTLNMRYIGGDICDAFRDANKTMALICIGTCILAVFKL